MEDDSDTANLFSILFKAKGNRVTIAYTAEEGLKIYSRSLQKLRLKNTPRTMPFDAIILDYNMPDRNGLEVAKEILTISPHQRIIFVSAYVEDTLSNSIKELNIPFSFSVPLPLYQVLSILNAIWFVITINVDFTSGSIETAKKDARMQ